VACPPSGFIRTNVRTSVTPGSPPNADRVRARTRRGREARTVRPTSPSRARAVAWCGSARRASRPRRDACPSLGRPSNADFCTLGGNYGSLADRDHVPQPTPAVRVLDLPGIPNGPSRPKLLRRLRPEFSTSGEVDGSADRLVRHPHSCVVGMGTLAPHRDLLRGPVLLQLLTHGLGQRGRDDRNGAVLRPGTRRAG
jgi:hypothetical protein